MFSFTYQPAFRPALPNVYGPLDYREQRFMFEHIDGILSASGLEQELINFMLTDRKIDEATTSAKRLERIYRYTVLAFRSNIARNLTGLGHREFCARLADSSLLQWFLHVGQVDSVKVFSKSSSDRFGRWISEESLRIINQKFVALLASNQPIKDGHQTPSSLFGLPEPINFDDLYFDSTCLKSDIHFPVDWVLLGDAARTLLKAIVVIRKHGLKNRMPQEPLAFLSEMNTLCMKMAAKSRAKDGKRQRKKVFREMKTLERRIADHATAHLNALKFRRDETDLSEAQAQQIINRIENVLDQLPAAIKQAHERIIGERRVVNEDKIFSLYDNSVNVIVRGKAGAKVEFGNKLWLGENKNGIIVDYKLYRDNPSDSSLIKSALERLLDDQNLETKRIWGDRGLASKTNSELLAARQIGDGLCPRNVTELCNRLNNDKGFRAGLKRRAGIEARIGIFKNVFLGRPLLAKGFEHRGLAVGWAALTHNLWVVGRMAAAYRKRKEAEQLEDQLPKARAA